MNCGFGCRRSWFAACEKRSIAFKSVAMQGSGTKVEPDKSECTGHDSPKDLKIKDILAFEVKGQTRPRRNCSGMDCLGTQRV